MVRSSRLIALVAVAVLLLGALPLHAATVTVAWDKNPESGVSYVVSWTAVSSSACPTPATSWAQGQATTALSYVISNLGAGKYCTAVRAVADGVYSDFSDAVPFSIDGTVTSPTALAFAARKAGSGGSITSVTDAQPVTVTVVGAATSWTVTANQPWVQILNGSGTGAGQFSVAITNPNNVIGGSTSLSATVTITPATGAPTTIAVNLSVVLSTGSAAPFGQMDTPVQNASSIVGTIGVTGWALDDVGVSAVQIFRYCLTADENAGSCQTVNGYRVVYVGNAAFLSGARPDVEAAFPGYPQSQRAGWGYLMLTNLLPNVAAGTAFGGQGTIQLYAFAVDADGNRTLLGRSQIDHTPTTIGLTNNSIAKPFGAIDTPLQGQTVNGWLANFGWVLTPDSNTSAGSGDILMPTNGSTVTVYIDGTAVGQVNYNQCRGTVGNPVPAGRYCDDDVSNIFGNTVPQGAGTARSANATKFRNLDAGRGAIGSFDINTATLTNGVHTIAWGVTDSSSRAEGIGSRFFNVLNTTSGDVAADAMAPAAAVLADAPAQVRGDASALAALPLATASVQGRVGVDLKAGYEDLLADGDGTLRVQLSELGRLELVLGPVEGGYLVANGTLRDLPPGSSLDPATGRYAWMPGVGYIGSYELVFLRGGERISVAVTIRPTQPAAPGDSEIRMFVDTPTSGQSVSGSFDIAGWALDPQAAFGGGIGAIHVWAQRKDTTASPVFLGAATLNGGRPDVAQAFGRQFNHAGYELAVKGLAVGQYDVTVYAWNIRTARWEDARTVSVAVR